MKLESNEPTKAGTEQKYRLEFVVFVIAVVVVWFGLVLLCFIFLFKAILIQAFFL